MITFFAVVLIHTVLSETYYQFIPQFSYNYKNLNIDNTLKEYYRSGEVIIQPKGIKFIPNIYNVSSSMVMKTPIKTNQFEVQLQFNIHPYKSSGAFFSIWFYNNNTDKELSLNSVFEGFGLIFTIPSLSEGGSNLNISIVVNDRMKSMRESIQLYNQSRIGCLAKFTGDTIDFTMKYDTRYLRVNHNITSLYGICTRYDLSTLLRSQFKFGIFAYNGDNIFPHLYKEKNDFNIIQNIQIKKISIFNINQQNKEIFAYKVGNISYSPSSKQVDLVEMYSKKLKEDIINVNITDKIIQIENYLCEANKRLLNLLGGANTGNNKKIKSFLIETKFTFEKGLKILNNALQMTKYTNFTEMDVFALEINQLIKIWRNFSLEAKKAKMENYTSQYLYFQKEIKEIQNKVNDIKLAQNYISKEVSNSFFVFNKMILEEKDRRFSSIVTLTIITILNNILIYLIFRNFTKKQKAI